MTACPKCGTEMVAGLGGPGLVSCPNLCHVEVDVAVAARPILVGDVDGVYQERLEGLTRDPVVHDAAVEERLRLQAGTGGPPAEEPPAEEPPAEEPPKEEPPKEEPPKEGPPVRVTPPRSRQ